jgi:hypothetical protein
MSGPPNNIIQLRKVKQKRAEGKTLCGSGFHQWETQKKSMFDVKQGKLVTLERCKRCNETRTKLS